MLNQASCLASRQQDEAQISKQAELSYFIIIFHNNNLYLDFILHIYYPKNFKISPFSAFWQLPFCFYKQSAIKNPCRYAPVATFVSPLFNYWQYGWDYPKFRHSHCLIKLKLLFNFFLMKSESRDWWISSVHLETIQLHCQRNK